MTAQLQTLWRSLRQGRFIRRVGILVGATGVGQAIAILVSPLLTRLYTPTDFGTYAVFAAIMGVLAAVACLRYESAIPVPPEPAEARIVLILSVLVALLMASVSALAIGLLGGWITIAVDTPDLRPLLWLLPLGVLLIGTYNALRRWAVRERDFVSIARTKLTQSVSAVVVQILLGVGTHSGPWGLALGSIAGQSAGIMTLFRRMRRTPIASSTPGHDHTVLKAAWRYRRFAMYSAPSALVNSLTLYAPSVLIAAFFGPAAAGFYALTQRVLGVPTTVLGKAISDVFLGEAAAAGRVRDFAGMVRLFRRTFMLLLVCSAALIGTVAFVAPATFGLVFGDAWSEAGLYVRALAPMYAMAFVASPFGGVLSVLERQDLFLLRELIRAPLVIGTLVVAAVIGASPLTAITALGLAGAVGYMIYVMLSWHAVRQVARKAEHRNVHLGDDG